MNNVAKIGYTIFRHTLFSDAHIEFDKNANSKYVYLNLRVLCYITFVGRQTEFAFFVRRLRLAHFLFLGGWVCNCMRFTSPASPRR